MAKSDVLLILFAVTLLLSPFYIWLIRKRIRHKEDRLYAVIMLVLVGLTPALNLAMAVIVGGLLLCGANKEWPNGMGDGFEDI